MHKANAQKVQHWGLTRGLEGTKRTPTGCWRKLSCCLPWPAGAAALCPTVKWTFSERWRLTGYGAEEKKEYQVTPWLKGSWWKFPSLAQYMAHQGTNYLLELSNASRPLHPAKTSTSLCHPSPLFLYSTAHKHFVVPSHRSCFPSPKTDIFKWSYSCNLKIKYTMLPTNQVWWWNRLLV